MTWWGYVAWKGKLGFCLREMHFPVEVINRSLLNYNKNRFLNDFSELYYRNLIHVRPLHLSLLSCAGLQMDLFWHFNVGCCFLVLWALCHSCVSNDSCQEDRNFVRDGHAIYNPKDAARKTNFSACIRVPKRRCYSITDEWLHRETWYRL